MTDQRMDIIDNVISDRKSGAQMTRLYNVSEQRFYVLWHTIGSLLKKKYNPSAGLRTFMGFNPFNDYMMKSSQLLSKGGLYKNLWDAQVGGFLCDEKMEDET